MKTLAASIAVVLVLVAGVSALGDKYAHPNYEMQNNRVRHRAKSVTLAQAPVAKPANSNAQLNNGLKKLENQTAAAQARRTTRPAPKAWAAPVRSPAPAPEKNKPINFQYVPPKNSTVQNHPAANTPTRKLMKPGYR